MKMNVEIAKISIVSSLNILSNDLTRKKIMLANMQHMSFNDNLERYQYSLDETEKLKKDIDYLEAKLLHDWVDGIATINALKEINNE